MTEWAPNNWTRTSDSASNFNGIVHALAFAHTISGPLIEAVPARAMLAGALCPGRPVPDLALTVSSTILGDSGYASSSNYNYNGFSSQSQT